MFVLSNRLNILGSLSWLVLILLESIAAQGVSKVPKKNLPQAVARIKQEIAEIEPGTSNALLRGRLYERLGDLQREQGHEKSACRTYRRALDAYAQVNSTRYRNRLLLRLSKTTTNKKWSKRAAAAFEELLGSWRQVVTLQTAATKLSILKKNSGDAEGKATRFAKKLKTLRIVARRQSDKALLASVYEVEGGLHAALGNEAKAIQKYRQGAKACGGETCPQKRQQLLKKVANSLENQGQLAEAFRLSAKLNAERATQQDRTQRWYVRSPELVRLCEKLRAQEGQTTICRKLEQAAVGFVTYQDFSRSRPKKGLSKDDIERVHQEYLPLLFDCLFLAVEQGHAQGGETFELAWTVKNNGQAANIELRPSSTADQTKNCLIKGLEVFRYPRYRGERQNITLPLTIEGGG